MACFAYAAWSPYEIPFGFGGLVSWPYSVIQIGVDARGFTGDTLVAHVTPEGVLGRDGWVQVPLHFTPEGSRTYYAQIEANDIHGNKVSRFLTIVSR